MKNISDRGDFLNSLPETNAEIEKEAIANPLDSLIIKSQQTLEQILDDPKVSTAEKADIALRILQVANSNRQFSPQLLTAAETAENLSLVGKESERDIKLFPAEYLQIDNFLKPQEHQHVLDIAFNKNSEFVNSKTITNAANYRKSSILYATLFPDLYYLVKNKILSALPSVLQQLKHPQFEVTRVEMQMTSHNDGCFYKAHTDAGSEKTKTRELTYVYYFYQEPKQFSGGELKLYDTQMQNNNFKQKERFQIVEPRNNSIVFFNSRCKHEVLPISCPSQDFQHGRFTLNGWLRS